jgi:predicted transcriptional regulator
MTNLLEDLDSIDLGILRAIAAKPDITTREIESIIRFSRVQVLRRLRQLRERGLIIKKNGTPGQTYYYELSSNVTPQEIEQYNQARLNTSRDPVAREALEVLLAGMQMIVGQLESILR